MARFEWFQTERGATRHKQDPHDNTESIRADQSRASAVDTHIQRIKIRRGSRKKHLGGLATLNFPSLPLFPTPFLLPLTP